MDTIPTKVLDPIPLKVLGSIPITWSYLPITALLISILWVAYQKRDREWMYPIINQTKEEYLVNGQAMVDRGKREVGDKPFRVYTGIGCVTILPSKYATEIKNNPHLDSTKFLLQYWQAGIPGFEPYIALGSDLTLEVIKKNLTQNDKFAWLQPALSVETAATLRDILTDSEEWHEVNWNKALLKIISRVSSLVFLGPELNRNDAWLDITTQYTDKATSAARVLRRWPRSLIYYIHWFLPEIKECRDMVYQARQIIKPILQKRREQQASGKTNFRDALGWYEEIAAKKGISYNAADHQLGLSVSAILTSTDLISQTIFDLCKNPQYIEPLREEIRSQLTGELKGTTLHNLKLMDSILKETLRLKPVALVGMGRRVTQDITLNDGTLLPKGAGIAVNAERMWSPDIYPNPRTYDGYRFLRMRDNTHNTPEGETKAMLVNTSAEHFGFGYGTHSCPGRFFGTAEVKIILSHFLMKYEFRLVEGTNAEPFRFGFSMLASPSAKLLIRRRRGEEVRF